MKSYLATLIVVFSGLMVVQIAQAQDAERCQHYENRNLRLSYSICSSSWLYGTDARQATTYCPAESKYAYAHICETGWTNELAPVITKTIFPPSGVKYDQFACIVENFRAIRNHPDFENLELRSRLICTDRMVPSGNQQLMGSLNGSLE